MKVTFSGFTDFLSLLILPFESTNLKLDDYFVIEFHVSTEGSIKEHSSVNSFSLTTSREILHFTSFYIRV